MEDVLMSKVDDCMDLPPGFRFHPTDEEIINCYLSEKVINSNFTARAIGEADLNKSEPWDLPMKAKMGEKEWYFFCQRDRKYPTGMRTNRATEAGYWKATGKDKEIYKGKGCLVGMKKTLVFYRGRAPKGEKSNWVMHEYRLEGKNSYYHLSRTTSKDEWVVCRVFHKSTGTKRTSISNLMRINSFSDDLLDSASLPSLLDPHNFNTNRPNSSFMDGTDEFKGPITESSNMKTTSTSDGNHFLYFPTNNYQGIQTNFSTPQNSIYYSQMPLSNPYPSSNISGHDQAFLRGLVTSNENYGLNRECKIEQFSSNQSILSVSQDTSMSNDRNTEISSVISKQEMASNMSNDQTIQEGPSSTYPVSDLDCLWNY